MSKWRLCSIFSMNDDRQKIVNKKGTMRYNEKILRSSLTILICNQENSIVTHYDSKITEAVCPVVDLPEIKASSEKCCSRHFDIYCSKKIILNGQLHVK